MVMEKIVIADDEQAIVELISAKLRAMGYEITAANTGREAVEKTHLVNPDLVLLDILMPDIDGYEVCRQLKSDPKTKNIPIIFLSGKLMERDVIKGLELGAQDYILKPFSPRELAVRVRRVLDMKDKTKKSVPAPALSHLEQKIDALSALHNVSTAMVGIRDIDELLQYILEQSLDVANAKIGSVMLLDEQNNLRISNSNGLSRQISNQIRIKLSEGISGSVAETGKPLLITNIEENNRFKRRSRQKYETKSLICVPIRMRDRVIGVLNVNNKKSGDVFNQEDLEILTLLANQAGVAIDNAELYKTMNESLVDYKVLEEATSRIIHSHSWKELLETLLNQAVVTTDAGLGLLFLADEETGELYLEAMTGKPTKNLGGLKYKMGEQTIGTAAKDKKSVIINHWNGEQDPLREKVRNVIGQPLAINGDVFGYFTVCDKTKDTDFSEKDLSSLGALSGELLGVLNINRVSSKPTDIKQQTRSKEVTDQETPSASYSTVAHELKTPLTSIHGFSELLIEQLGDITNKSQKHYLDLINSESARLSDLIQDLLDLTKLEANQAKLDRRPTQLEKIVDQVTSLLSTSLADFNVSVQIPDDLLPAIIDSNMVTQILINLLTNAITYAHPGDEIEIKVSEKRDQFLISVRNSGIGLAPEEQEKIFEKFYRVDNEINRQTPGTGLGLSIVKRLVDLQGGRIWVESDTGRDTKFTFSLPKHLVQGNSNMTGACL
ncbi:MAG TPA: response regulator [Actinobacteria bacterium]|nr:response regulator [Actinomycetota bacterium]